MLNLRLPPGRCSIVRCRLVPFLLLFLLTASNFLYGRAFYVSTSGNDSNSGSLTSPWRTFAHAIPNLYPGDTLYARAGSYRERVYVGTRSGYRVAPIVIKNYPGEVPIIDGRWPFSDMVSVPLSAGLLHVRARNIIVEGFKVRRSNACGIMSDVTYGTFRKIQVDSCWQSGIYVGGDSSVVEDCKVWNVNLNNYNGAAYANGAWGLGITMARGGGGQDAGEDNVTDGGIIRRDTVYDCWGEGISTYQAKGTKIDSCVIWDAWSTSLYVQNAAYCHVNGCLVYSTRDLPNGQGGYRRATTYSFSNEVGSDTVVNRFDTLSFCCGYGGWAMFRTTLGNGSLCVNNTFVNSPIAGSIRVVDYHASGWVFKNNIIEQDNGLAVSSCDNSSGLVFTSSNNCWYGSTPASWAQGAGSLYNTNPQLVGGDASAGHMTRDWFKLQSTSPAINAGTNVGFPYQGSAPDMGAMEYGSASSGSGSTTTPIPSLLSPANNATGQPTTIAFSWTATTNATSYQLQVSVDPNFSVIYKEANPVNGISYTMSGLATGIQYYWRVRASVSGQTGAWSTVSTFTTVSGSSTTLAPAPTLLTPINGATAQPTTLAFSWSAVPNATGYRLQVSTALDFSTLAFEVVPVYGTSSTISGLAANTTYYWRVRASVGDQMGAWPTTSSFTTAGGATSTPPAAPTLSTPPNGATGLPTAVTFSWMAATNATSYQLQVSVDPNFSVIYKEAVPVYGTSTTVSGLPTGIRYYWRVRASAGGLSGAWSAASSFSTVSGSWSTLAPAPTLLTPANGATGQATTVTFSWSAVPNATGYRLQVSKNSNFSNLSYEAVPVYGTSITVSGLAAGTRYYWRVRASVGDQMGAWPATSSFTTSGTRPASALVGLLPNSLDFGSAPVGETRALPLFIDNNGSDTLRVTNITISNPAFSIDRTSLVLGPDECYADTIRVSASVDSGSITGTAVIQSNSSTLSDTIVLKFDAVGITIASASTPSAPTSYALLQNYPNPFNPTTTIAYSLPEASRVTIEVFDILGARVRTLIGSQDLSAGLHTVQWDGRNDNASRVSTGMYIYRIKANSFSATKTMLLLN